MPEPRCVSSRLRVGISIDDLLGKESLMRGVLCFCSRLLVLALTGHVQVTMLLIHSQRANIS